MIPPNLIPSLYTIIIVIPVTRLNTFRIAFPRPPATLIDVSTSTSKEGHTQTTLEVLIQLLQLELLTFLPDRTPCCPIVRKVAVFLK